MQFSAIDVLYFFSLSSCLSITVSLLALLAKGSVLNLGRHRPSCMSLLHAVTFHCQMDRRGGVEVERSLRMREFDSLSRQT